jgi:DNA-binding winged helix-turn-helix (wHTH) protein
MPLDQYEFGTYRLDTKGRILFRGSEHVVMPPRLSQLLIALVEAQGKVLTREELVRCLWPDAVVEDGSLTSHVSMLRKALGKAAQGHDFIETLPKRGYRFAAPVKRIASTMHDRGTGRTMLAVLPFENLATTEK